MDLVLCHITADFDTLGAAVGAACLRPGSRIVLTGGAHESVYNFLALWRDEYPLTERRAVKFDQVRSLILVDACDRDRFAPVRDWFDQAEARGIPIVIYDHHGASDPSQQAAVQVDSHSVADASLPGCSPGDDSARPSLVQLPMAEVYIEPVGAATTLLVEAIQRQGYGVTPAQATVMALGIHSDTGSLTFDQSTDRDAAALAWLMAQGANLQVIAENREPTLSPRLQHLMSVALETCEIESIRGHQLGWVCLQTDAFAPGLSGVAERLIELLGLDTLILLGEYQAHNTSKAALIGRSRANFLLPESAVDLKPIFQAVGGGGHQQAASAILKGDYASLFDRVLEAVRSQIPYPITAAALMSSPVRTILPTATVDEAARVLLRYGHAGLCVVDEEGQLVGVVSRRDIDLALRHGLGHGSVKGCMSVQIQTITPETPIHAIYDLMTTFDIGRLPVLKSGELVGIVTRTDLLRRLSTAQAKRFVPAPASAGKGMTAKPALEAPALPMASVPPPPPNLLYRQLQHRIPEIWPAIELICAAADQRGWALYLVGGGVRDLLLSMTGKPCPLTDIDLVVDGAQAGAGVILAEAIQAQYPQVNLQVHGQFQTASLIWHRGLSLQSSAVGRTGAEKLATAPLDEPADEPILIDIATARTEFYPYPAANPEVEASTIRQDLYRRDFTINAMALQLNGGRAKGPQFRLFAGPEPGYLLDFFGGWRDLQQCHVRVLHANSFIEDPTRIFRAVRFAVRLDFAIDPQTEQFIQYAVNSGIYERMRAREDKTPALQTRLKAELKYLLSAHQWEASLAKIERLGALACIHRDLSLTPGLWRQLRRMNRWLNKFEVAVPRWLVLLELMISQLEPACRVPTAVRVDLDAQSLHRLKHLHEWEENLLEKLPAAHQPSQIYDLLQAYKPIELLLLSDRHPYRLGPKIWQYILRLSRMPTPISGDTLKRLGYKPGPQFRGILADVHRAMLDGLLTSTEAAERYVLERYPLASA